MLKLYIAGGLFAAFLLLSLILVLVKIERNLRSTKIEDIVENLRSNYTEIIQGMWQGGDDEFEY